uniref:Vitellogenin domain-containing protein n=1 Tax=Monopterus albus TaxID=43700 RepID=A0A3Q3KQI4_MONAL
MGDSKLCLLLLLSISASALARRYKTLQKYKYRYEAETYDKQNIYLLSQVETEVPQTCSFIVRTTGCSLSEVVGTDSEGNPVFRSTPSSGDFAGVYDVKLYPEDDETTTILNIKRGIISALAVPLEEDENKYMPTIHGMCKTYYTVNAREDIATDITLNRDLSSCDTLGPMRDYTSPLALISGMLFRCLFSALPPCSQTCNYKFDNEKKHMTSGSSKLYTRLCKMLLTTHLKRTISKWSLKVTIINYGHVCLCIIADTVRGLYMETVEETSVIKDKDANLSLLRELATLPETEGERRAHLLHKLVSMVHRMKAETLSPTIPEVLALSRVLTYQVLAQCGTPECGSAIMQVLRTFDTSSLNADATVFAMGLMYNPSALLICDMVEMAKYNPSKPIMYALSNVVKR